MSKKDPSIADIIAQFAIKPPSGTTADAWISGLAEWLEGPYEKLVHPERKPGLHASGLGKVCARREVLEEVFGAPDNKKKAGNFLTFDIGHAMHFWWQHRYLGPKGELWGDWECLGCRKTVTGFMPLDCPCGAPWQDAIRYHELAVEDKELGYVGHSDGIIVDQTSGVRRIFEFKTCGPQDYMELRAPKWDHIVQAHAYMRCLGPQEALIVYMDKGKQADWTMTPGGTFIATTPHIKAFVVPFDPVVWNPIEERIKEHHSARGLIEALRADGTRPSQSHVEQFRRVCDSPRCEQAKYCPVVKQCFNLGVK